MIDFLPHIVGHIMHTVIQAFSTDAIIAFAIAWGPLLLGILVCTWVAFLLLVFYNDDERDDGEET